ncbi:MAG: DUF2177 family protein [Chloroflexi bacterium]|nr:DUF2177 family protein [Chloroflexota bacterium]
MPTFAILYLATVPVFFLIDLVWLGLVARDFYRDQMGSLMADPINWPAGILFYLLWVAGLILFAVTPALDGGDWVRALLLGAAFGFITYATYDLTNLATLRDWSLPLTLVDLAWGTVLGGVVATASYLLGRNVLGI